MALLTKEAEERIIGLLLAEGLADAQQIQTIRNSNIDVWFSKFIGDVAVDFFKRNGWYFWKDKITNEECDNKANNSRNDCGC